jgi:hypothetical protein
MTSGTACRERLSASLQAVAAGRPNVRDVGSRILRPFGGSGRARGRLKTCGSETV